MFATVTYPYRDRETYEIHRTGDTVELTPDRFAELSASGSSGTPSARSIGSMGEAAST